MVEDNAFDSAFDSFSRGGGRSHADSRVSNMPQKRPQQMRTQSEQVPAMSQNNAATRVEGGTIAGESKGGFLGGFGRVFDKVRPSQAQARTPQQAQAMSSQQAAEIQNLPDELNLKSVKRNPTEACMLCENPFTQKLKLLNRNPIRHCKRCGKSVCEPCSSYKRQLSKQDPEKYRVCDHCDFLMENTMLLKNLGDVKKAQSEKIETLNSHVEQLHDDKDMLKEDQEQVKATLQRRLDEKYEINETLRCNQNKMKKEIQQQTNAKNSLQQSISDLQKVVEDFTLEQRRLKTKQSSLLGQTMELETELSQRELLTGEQLSALMAIKLKIS